MATNNNAKVIKNVINVTLLVIVLILIIQNIYLVRINFLFFSLRMPLLLLIGGVFAIGWFTSKATGGVLDTKKIKDSITKVETSVEGALNKGIHNAQEIAGDIKDETEEFVGNTKAVITKAKNSIQKRNERRAPAKKPTPTPTKRTPPKK